MKKLGFKIWFMIAMLIVSFLFIFAGSGLTKKGVEVTSISIDNNSLYDQGLHKGSLIISVDGQTVDSLEDYSRIIGTKFISGKEEKLTIGVDGEEYIIFSDAMPDLSVSDLQKTNLKLGLDLAGGSRALVKAENKTLTSEEVVDLVDITANRLNAFGLNDLKVAPVSDLAGNNYMSIEIAGATPKDLKKMVGEQGKFEAKIGNDTVFIGGNRDVASVGRDAQNARIEGCNPSEEGTTCRFSFSITLSGAAAQNHADITDKLLVNRTANGNYLSEKLELFLDDRLVDSLYISESLKGRLTTQISISGSGVGATQDDALVDAKANMKELQTILMTGSLPYKLEIVKLDSISPILGEEFINSIFLAGGIAILIVSIIIFIRYKNWKASMALVVTTVAEVVIVLGIAALIDWNLDLPGIAGILATIGTGIDDLIIILDESMNTMSLTLKERLKRAFAIIMGAYFTTFVSLLPLMWAGAGLLKGFAITTIIGISVGVFITRPAFSEIIRRFRK
ncbi:MAG: hypothetical protein PF542_05220 [Nanoarchaeota archaeon]|jgi:preprotein translocase subunit SecD|nr:hypothetical protein [Nanoarchaeota archaeon]